MKNNQNIIKYTSHEINNFNNGKVRILQRKKDIIEFIEFSAKNPSNAKLYFGKIGERLSIDIKNSVNVNVKDYNISIKTDSIRHILNHHSNKNEVLWGQIPIEYKDFELITTIISEYNKIIPSGHAYNGKSSITFKAIMNCTYYLVIYVSDKSKSLEIQTMYKIKTNKKNSATVSDAKSPN